MTTNPSPESETVTVRLVGGHPRWADTTLDVERKSLDGPLDDVGALLMIPDGSFPDHLATGHPDVDWRAHYAPETNADRAVWRFQGWVPW